MPKVYSVEEANALLPYLAPTLVELREKYEEAAADQTGDPRSRPGQRCIRRTKTRGR